MSDVLTERLNRILPKITSDAFLSGSGIGNELAFYIFDYPPEAELRVREHLRFLLDHLPKQRPGLRVKHLNLFDFMLEYLQSRHLLEKAIAMQQERGDLELKRALAGPLQADKLAPLFGKAVQPEQHDVVLVSGVGSVYPLVRTHTLLNNLHSILGKTPLVMFYPGRYDGLTLRLFGRLRVSSGPGTRDQNKDREPYYRAFRLVP